jgi:signal transduction histidine kinase
MTIIMVCISIIIGVTALHYMRKNVLERIEGNLDIAIQQVEFLFRDWTTLNERNLQTITKDEKFVALVQQQLLAYKAGKTEEQGSLTELRAFFTRHEDRWGKSGFFVIAPDCINIASMRDSNIGVRNLIVDHRPELLYSALDGNSVFVPPIPSDVALEGQKNIAGMDVPPTLFFVAPIIVNGKVIALLAQRHDIRNEYMGIFKLTRPSLTGETYAFDKNGRLLSDSRFADQLSDMGIATHDEQAIWSMYIKDPMQNLLRKPVENYNQSGKPFTLMAQRAMSKESGISVKGYRDYRGVDVMGAWIWNDDLNTGIALEIDVDDALSSYNLIKTMIIAIIAVQIFFLMVLIITLTRINAYAMEVLHLSKDELESLIKERTESLEQAQNELLLANEELEEFAYRTSHDLRSPLLSSIKLLSMADACLEKGDIQQTKNCMSHVNISLEKLEVLVSDILTLTKAKNLNEDEKIVIVSDVVQDCIDKIAQMDGFSRLDIRVNLTYDVPMKLKAHRFVLIVENLISNAVKYQDPDESAPFIDIRSHQDGDNFILEVHDNGLGFPEDQRDQMFAMFKRFHPKTSYGSGLGMYMIKKSVDILDGEIVFEAPEKGTIFKVTIPLNADV